MKVEKIAIGMSGGVDSSVSAMLLHEAGHQVVGITMVLRPQEKDESRQSLYQEAEDAAAVCKKLGIPHFVADYSQQFQTIVMDYFVGEYLVGRTPNPCIRCNSAIKFGLMLDFALSLSCNAVATGHWAELESKGDRVLLKRADSPKDQSYFLYALTQHQLQHIRFPLKSGEKEALRALARKRGLPVANKPDSQDVCFIRDGDYIRFLEEYATEHQLTLPAHGSFVDETGATVGTHRGLHRYTVGQRRGLGVSFGERRFVTGLDPKINTVQLGGRENGESQMLTAMAVNWIAFDVLTHEMEVTAKTRYRARPVKARIIPQEQGQVLVRFAEPQQFLTPGQAVVFYDGAYVVGGGIIQ